jgi:competence protein ComEA
LFNGKLDLNTADADSLARIRGIGPALANRIVAAREERGGFRSVSDLDDVDGIGPKLLERIAAEVDVLAAAPSLRTPESATTSTTR